MKKQHFDIIGDIHGCYDKLILLLKKLGYKQRDGLYYHPEGKKAAFLGDFIDPKGDLPHDVPAVLKTVKNMVEAKTAIAVLGNHEFNAVAYSTKNVNGDYLRPHLDNKDKGLQITLEAFKGGINGREWQEYVDWFKTLPFFVEEDGFRIVHAYWNSEAIEALRDRTLNDARFLTNAATPGTQEYEWVEYVLKGYEVPMPEGYTYFDHIGVERDKFRTKWFDRSPHGKFASELVFPVGNYDIPAEPVPPETTALIPGYANEAPPLFFGHYFKPGNDPLTPELPNLTCLDYSVAKGGPMVAYRWEGEKALTPAKFIAV